MADLEDCRQPPRVVAFLCVARGGVPVPPKQPLARKLLFSPVMGAPRQLDHLSDSFLKELLDHLSDSFLKELLDHLSDSFLTDLDNEFLLAAKGNMDNKFPPNSPEEIRDVQADFPFDTMAWHDLVAQGVPGALPTVHMVRSVPLLVGEGRPLKSSYNAEHGHAKTILHELGVQRALMLGAGTGSSYSNAVMVDLWLDSGASCHVIGNEGILSNRHDPPAGGRPLRVADGVEHEVESIGTIDIPGFKIPNVRFIRQFENLISVGQLAEDHKIRSYLDEECCILWVGQGRTLVGEGIKDKRNGLYRLTFLLVP